MTEQQEKIIKTDKVGYLYTKIQLMNGHLTLTSTRLELRAKKAVVGGFGLLGAIIGSAVQKKTYGFDLEFGQIKKIEIGKFRRIKTLDVTDNQHKIYRITMTQSQLEGWLQALENFVNI